MIDNNRIKGAYRAIEGIKMEETKPTALERLINVDATKYDGRYSLQEDPEWQIAVAEGRIAYFDWIFMREMKKELEKLQKNSPEDCSSYPPFSGVDWSNWPF